MDTNRVLIDEATLKNAVSYAPIRAKDSFLEYAEPGCVQRVDIKLNDDENTVLPYMYTENTNTKSRYMMTALAVLYLGIPLREIQTEPGDIWLMTEQEYDRWAGSHVLNQMERLKGNAELRDKVFDLLRDYRDLEKRLSVLIHNSLEIRNDPCNRLFQKILSDLSEENLKAQQAEAEKLKAEFEALKAKHMPEPVVPLADPQPKEE